MTADELPSRLAVRTGQPQLDVLVGLAERGRRPTVDGGERSPPHPSGPGVRGGVLDARRHRAQAGGGGAARRGAAPADRARARGRRLRHHRRRRQAPRRLFVARQLVGRSRGREAEHRHRPHASRRPQRGMAHHRAGQVLARRAEARGAARRSRTTGRCAGSSSPPPISAPTRRSAAIVVNFTDITERKLADEALAHQALHDPVTGLPEPPAPDRPPRAGPGPGRAERHTGRRALLRRRPLQARQRQPRPPGRRPRAAGAGGPVPRRRPRQSTRWFASVATSSCSCARTSTTSTRPGEVAERLTARHRGAVARSIGPSGS